MNVKGNYLKNESGSIFSPIVSTDTIYHNGQKLSTFLTSLSNSINIKLGYKKLWSGDNNMVPSKNSGQTLTINLGSSSGIKLSTYTALLIGNSHRTSILMKRSDDNGRIASTARPVAFIDVSDWSNEYTNIFGCFVQTTNEYTITFKSAQLTKILNTTQVTIDNNYASLNITDIYGLIL